MSLMFAQSPDSAFGHHILAAFTGTHSLRAALAPLQAALKPVYTVKLSPLHAALLVILLVFTRVAFARLTKQTVMSVNIKWGRERLRVDLPPPNMRLGHIRKSLAEHTHLPEHAFKLVHAGAVMKDDNAPISAYGIRDNSTIVIIGSDAPPPSAPSAPAQPYPAQQHVSERKQKQQESRTEQSTISLIQAELDKVRTTLWPSVDTFLSYLSPQPLEQQTQPEVEHRRLSELLLQSLLRLDAITVSGNGTWDEARRERKEAVKEVQDLLDRLDEGWSARAR